MHKYHSTVTRRDFMKTLGLGVAGVGAVAASAPIYNDLDDMLSSNTHDLKVHKQWWIKENDIGNITTKIDWNMWQPFDTIRNPGPIMSGPGANGAMSPENTANRTRRQKEGVEKNWGGSTLRDLALDQATNGIAPSTPWDGAGSSKAESLGVPRWQGVSPEDNTIMCRAAAHMYGSPKCGAMLLDETTKKLFDTNVMFVSNTESGEAELKDGKYLIPSKFKYIVTWVVKQSHTYGKYTMRNNPDDPWYNKVFRLGKAGENQAYSHGPQIRAQMVRFITALGYKAVKPEIRANTQFGVWSGLAESGRTSYALSPIYGLMMRQIDWFLTDLPLAPTKPIDGGMLRFCKSCMTCAKYCPSDTISMEKNPSFDTVCTYNVAGLETWYLDWDSCAKFGGPFDCVSCQVVCPFSHENEHAAVHNIIRTTQKITPIFNGFFANMEEIYGYNKQFSDKKLHAWWYRDLDTWKHDTLLGFGTKGW